MQTPTFLKNNEVELIEDTELARLTTMVSQLQVRQDEVDELSRQLSEAKEAARVLGQEQIPAILSQYGLSEVRLKSGIKVIVKADASVSVPEEKRLEFFAFLKARDEEDIIKLQMQFKKMPLEKQNILLNFLNQNNYEFEYDRGVHPMTLKAYFKKLIGVGEEEEDVARGVANGMYLRKEDVQAFANVFTFFSTKLKG